MYHGIFVQDDWKVTDKLTLNLGLRYEYEGAPTERDDRNLRGFDPNAELAISGGGARPPMRATRSPSSPPASSTSRGGLRFAGDGGRGYYNADKNNIQPRLGLAYQWNPKTVVRAGWAIYAVPALFDDVIRQSGFAQATTIVPTLDNGLTIQADAGQAVPERRAGPAGQRRRRRTRSSAASSIGSRTTSTSGTGRRCAGRSACSASCRRVGGRGAPTSATAATT